MYEADQRHAELVCDNLGLTQQSKGAYTPAAKQETHAEMETELAINQASQYRALVARANYLAQQT